MRSLAERHRPRILAHLLALPPQDRYLRFGYAASDEQVARYTELIDFARDEVFGIFNRRLELIAQAHLAALSERHEAEFGVSVLPQARGRGYGGRLFDHAVLHARNRGIGTLVVHVMAENTAMLKIARNAGAVVERDGGEALARLRLPPEDLRSRLDALVEDGAAEIDYHLKLQARRVSDAIDVIDDLKTQLKSVHPTTPE
ncbi:MAG TPA: GNAT family N-acetyltransferase [Burkholderiaceae bacterium]|nr:GNAT family N-acetyltransferase [Burkholderiaceae bacterium]